jgi:hypothetical protein
VTTVQIVELSKGVLTDVLAPYKSHCRYVKGAVIELPNGDPDADFLVRIRGDLTIDESCYIDDTGHFNSVEFNICYNQLVYLLMAQCVQSGLLPCFERWTYDEYLRRQLPDVLIHDFASRFSKPMHIAEFSGTVDILGANERRKFLLLRTRCSFRDDHGGKSDGEVSLAIVDRSVGAG